MAPPIEIIILDIVGVVIVVWFLTWRIRSKLIEVEERHVMSGIRKRKKGEEE